MFQHLNFSSSSFFVLKPFLEFLVQLLLSLIKHVF